MTLIGGLPNNPSPIKQMLCAIHQPQDYVDFFCSVSSSDKDLFVLTVGLLFGSCLMCVAYLIFSPLCLLNIYHYVRVCVYACACFQEEAAVRLSAHSQAVSIRHPEADALPDRSHSENNSKISTSLSLSSSLSVVHPLCGSHAPFLFHFFCPYCQLVSTLCAFTT